MEEFRPRAEFNLNFARKGEISLVRSTNITLQSKISLSRKREYHYSSGVKEQKSPPRGRFYSFQNVGRGAAVLKRKESFAVCGRRLKKLFLEKSFLRIFKKLSADVVFNLSSISAKWKLSLSRKRELHCSLREHGSHAAISLSQSFPADW